MASVVRYGFRTYQFPTWDEQHYMTMAAGFYRLFQHPTPTIASDLLQFVPLRQPGYPLAMLPFLLIFGLSNSYFWGIFTNGLFYVATIFGVYFIAKNYYSRTAAFVASIVFASYGWTLLHVHVTYSETATSAFCVWAIYFLIKSNLFQNRKNSILFGLFFGLGLLTRWVAAVFVAGPLLFILYRAIREGLLKKAITNAAVSFLITALVSIYPYYHNFSFVFEYFRGHRVGGAMWQLVPGEERSPLSFYTLTFYLRNFQQLGVYYFILIVWGFILALRPKSKLAPILAAIIVPWIFFSFFSILKADRFIVPIYPYLAIISASVFDPLKNKGVRTILIVFIIVLSALSFFGAVWGKGPMGKSLVSISLPLPVDGFNKIYLTTISRPPYIYKISGKEIVEFLIRDSRESKIENPQVLSLFYYRPLDEPIMTHNLYQQVKPLNIVNFLGTVIPDPNDVEYVINMAASSNYVLIKTGKRVDKSFTEINFKTLKGFIRLFDEEVDLAKYYEQKTKFWIYQDSSEVTVYKKKAEIPPDEIENLKLKLTEYLKQN